MADALRVKGGYLTVRLGGSALSLSIHRTGKETGTHLKYHSHVKKVSGRCSIRLRSMKSSRSESE